MRAPGVEPGSTASETATLSIVLRPQEESTPGNSRVPRTLSSSNESAARSDADGFSIFPPASPEFVNNRKDGQDDDGQDHQLEVLLDEGLVAEHEPRVGEEVDPDERPNDIVGDETGIGHSAYTRDKRHKCPNDRHKAREDDGTTAIFFEERVGAIEVFAAEENRVFALENRRPQLGADPIVQRVSNYGCNE